MTQNAFPPRAHVPPYRQLRRPTTDRIVAGVCSGLGRYFDVDPVLIRVLFAIAVVFTGGLALLAYPVLWFLMPEEGANAPAWPTSQYVPPTPPPGAAGTTPSAAGTAPVPTAEGMTPPVPPAAPMTPPAGSQSAPPAPPTVPPASPTA
jgi:phage shock protein PspC (stress-responsive transcriptional regulator)